MTIAKRLGFIAMLTLFSAVLPRMSHAQEVYGNWTGVESFSTTLYVNGQPVENYSGTNIPATFSITANSPDTEQLFMAIGGNVTGSIIYGYGLLSPLDAFGPTSAAGFMVANGGPYNIAGGDFSLTYQSIFPDGQIVNGSGSAFAELGTGSVGATGIFGSASFSSASFITVPEPSSIVQVALTVLSATLVFVWRSVRRTKVTVQ